MLCSSSNELRMLSWEHYVTNSKRWRAKFCGRDSVARILEEYEQLLMQWSGFCEDVNGGHLLQIWCWQHVRSERRLRNRATPRVRGCGLESIRFGLGGHRQSLRYRLRENSFLHVRT